MGGNVGLTQRLLSIERQYAPCYPPARMHENIMSATTFGGVYVSVGYWVHAAYCMQKEVCAYTGIILFMLY